MSFELCAKCGRYGFADSHKCPPIWECAIDELDPEWRDIYAGDAADAAEIFAERYDIDSAEYSIVRAGDGGNTIILVRPQGTTLGKRFRVFGESVPVYHARELG